MVSQVDEQESEFDDAVVEPFPAKRVSLNEDVSKGNTNRPRRTRSTPVVHSKDRIESFHNAIIESMEETQRIRQSHLGSAHDSSNTSVLLDTVKDIKSAASGTIASLKEWAVKNNDIQGNEYSSERNGFSQDHASRGVSLTDSDNSGTINENGECSKSGLKKNTLIQDLAWPFVVCGIDMSSDKNDFAPHVKKMKDAVAKVVKGNMNAAADDIWKFAAVSRDDDENTVLTLDTLQEENNQIRRLGSWGTVGTAGTNGTCDTGFNSLDPSFAPGEIRVGVEDDDGNYIDPVLLEKAQKTREKRHQRRRKLVKFDYPPIKSLRQCPRHNPDDLPDLFFTEGELDQIEDDRYSTMSTDDIEIVAVADQVSSDSKARRSKSKRGGATFSETVKSNSPDGREQPEAGWKQTKGRPSTPHRRRQSTDDNPDFPTSESKSPTNRLVKGVQIYLRERSTGA